MKRTKQKPSKVSPYASNGVPKDGGTTLEENLNFLCSPYGKRKLRQAMKEGRF